jgi:CRP-like cAMP-binding protein
VSLKLGEVLYEPGIPLRYVYFPTTAIVSLLYVMEDGASAEIAIVGNEGILGIALFMGGETTPSRAVVQSAGYGYRLKAQLLKDEFGRFGPFLRLLLRYTQALITQMAQTAVCNRHHSVDQQLCRWLLLSLDRLSSSELSMTQELIANMLGVRREGVTEAAGKLQLAGLIQYRRGKITVLDRPRLEARSCECYQVVKTEFDRLLPYVARLVPKTARKLARHRIRLNQNSDSPADKEHRQCGQCREVRGDFGLLGLGHDARGQELVHGLELLSAGGLVILGARYVGDPFEGILIELRTPAPATETHHVPTGCAEADREDAHAVVGGLTRGLDRIRACVGSSIGQKNNHR